MISGVHLALVICIMLIRTLTEDEGGTGDDRGVTLLFDEVVWIASSSERRES